jgi:hypothetical protein
VTGIVLLQFLLVIHHAARGTMRTLILFLLLTPASRFILSCVIQPGGSVTDRGIKGLNCGGRCCFSLAGDPAACLAVMRRAQQAGWVSFSERPPLRGNCPLAFELRHPARRVGHRQGNKRIKLRRQMLF